MYFHFLITKNNVSTGYLGNRLQEKYRHRGTIVSHYTLFFKTLLGKKSIEQIFIFDRYHKRIAFENVDWQ